MSAGFCVPESLQFRLLSYRTHPGISEFTSLRPRSEAFLQQRLDLRGRALWRHRRRGGYWASSRACSVGDLSPRRQGIELKRRPPLRPAGESAVGDPAGAHKQSAHVMEILWRANMRDRPGRRPQCTSHSWRSACRASWAVRHPSPDHPQSLASILVFSRVIAVRYVHN